MSAFKSCRTVGKAHNVDTSPNVCPTHHEALSLAVSGLDASG